MNPPQCLVIGVDNHVGAYLARLLDARGIGAAGGLAGVGDTRLLARLGVTETIVPVARADVAATATAARLVFAISDGSADRADLVAEVIAAAGAAKQPPRVIHVADLADLPLAPVRETVRRITAVTGLAAANVLLEAHDSRLGRSDSLIARIIAAALAASSSEPADASGQRLAIAETGPRDWGWTPEYVDAILRLALRDRLSDMIVASGHHLTTAAIAEHAFGYFRRRAEDHVDITGSGTASPLPDPAPLAAATGWRASTHGRDLVRALCEGASEQSPLLARPG